MADKIKRALDYWCTGAESAKSRRQSQDAAGWHAVGDVILTEKYETKNGTVVFQTEGTDMEFVAVERGKMLWYLGVVDELDQMGTNPFFVLPANPDKL